VEYKDVAELVLLGESARFITICANNDRNISKTLFDEKWFVAPVFPLRRLRADNQHASADAAVSARQNHRTISTISETFSERNNQWCFAGAANCQVADANNRVMKPQRCQNTGSVKFLAGLKYKSKRLAHRHASAGFKTCITRSVAPVFC